MILDEDSFFEAADVPDKSISIESIKYVGFSTTAFSDLSYLFNAPKLEIVVFRLCNFTQFPKEFFQIPNLRSIDLSGNSINTLPDSSQFQALKNLRLLNIQDNGIINLSEVYKINGCPQIRTLILTGNICLSQNDSYNQIIRNFPTLVILNDAIITSQYRAFLENRAISDDNNCLPTSKMDEFIFLYMKYLHASSNERYSRRFNSDQFCLSRVMRKYSAADRIQSVFRGFLLRVKYKKLRRASLNIEAIMKIWFHKRFQAAIRIQCCYLYSRTRTQIKFIRAARKIQSTWRRRIARQLAIIEVFEINNQYCFLIPQKDIDKVKLFIESNHFKQPKSIEKTWYKIIRINKPNRVKLPGSPMIFYSNSGNLIVRTAHQHEKHKNSTIWCYHDHKKMKTRIKVTKNGINWTHQCLFASIPVIKITTIQKPVKLNQYDRFYRFVYDRRDDLALIVKSLVNSHNSDIVLYPERVLITSSSQITMQSAFRSFIDRMKYFHDLKQQALESRAISIIRYSFKTSTIQRSITHISNVMKYYKSLPNSQSFYIPYEYYSTVMTMKKKYDITFGYSSDKSLVLDSVSNDDVMLNIIPQGKIMFALSDLPSLISMNVASTKAQPSMFNIPIPIKYLKRYRIMRLLFFSPVEAKRRLALFAWLTDQYNIIMTEQDVLEFCYANIIHSCWRGHAARVNFAHVLAQHGKPIKSDLKSLFKYKRDNDYENSITNQTYQKLHNQNEESEPLINKALKEAPSNSIQLLRHDYKPWINQLNNYKEEKEYLKKIEERKPKIPNKNEEDVTQESMNIEFKDLQGISVKSLKPKSLREVPNSPPLHSTPVSTPNPHNLISKIKNTEEIKLIEKKYPAFRPESQMVFLSPPKVVPRKISKDDSILPKKTIKDTSTNTEKENKKVTFQMDDYTSIHNNSKQIRNEALETVENHFDDPRLLAPFFTGSSQKKIRDPTIVAKPELETTNNCVQVLEKNISEKKTLTFQELVKISFTKLSRLHHLGTIIASTALINSRIETNKQMAQQARETLQQQRIDNQLARLSQLAETRERAAIEKEFFTNEIEESKEKSLKKKAKKVKDEKEELRLSREKFIQSKTFGQNFVNMARMISHKAEMSKKGFGSMSIPVNSNSSLSLKAVNTTSNPKQKLMIQKAVVSSLRQQKLDNKALLKQFNQEIDMQKKRITRLDKMYLERKKSMNEESKENKLRAIYESKRKEKERKQLLKLQQNERLHYYNSLEPQPPPVEEDPNQIALKSIGNYLGSNLGDVESQMLIDLISQIL